MTDDDYTVSRWGPAPRPVPRWLVDKVSRLGEVSGRILFGLPLDDAPATFQATVPPPPDPAEVLATIRRYLEPSHTLVVSEEHADRVRRAVEESGAGRGVEVVASPFVTEGQAYLIDHSAFEKAWRVPTPSWAEVARPGATRGSAVRDTCCDLHGRNCEQGGEECCHACTEAHHFDIGHGGVPCSNPDLSGNGEAHARS